MFNQFQNNQIDNMPLESETEYEEIEIYERDRYEPNELFPCNINFVLPGKLNQNFISQNKPLTPNHSSYSSNISQHQINQYNNIMQKDDKCAFCGHDNKLINQDVISLNQNIQSGIQNENKIILK